MNPLHATIEEFAAEGYSHVECFCPRCRRDQAQAYRLVTQNIAGPHYRAALGEASLCGVRRSIALGQAVANG